MIEYCPPIDRTDNNSWVNTRPSYTCEKSSPDYRKLNLRPRKVNGGRTTCSYNSPHRQERGHRRFPSEDLKVFQKKIERFDFLFQKKIPISFSHGIRESFPKCLSPIFTFLSEEEKSSQKSYFIFTFHSEFEKVFTPNPRKFSKSHFFFSKKTGQEKSSQREVKRRGRKQERQRQERQEA